MTDGISLETFIKADDKTRHRMTFELLQDIREHSCIQKDKCEVRFKTLENRKLIDRTWSVLGGGVGGFLAVLGKTLFK